MDVMDNDALKVLESAKDINAVLANRINAISEEPHSSSECYRRNSELVREAAIWMFGGAVLWLVAVFTC